jgi:hypothetical protein
VGDRRRSAARAGAVLFAGTLAALAFAAPSGAVPRYALRVGQSCMLCHQNPDGGGARSTYASQYLIPTRLAMAHAGVDESAEPATNPQVTKDLVVGADLRTFYLNQEKRDARNNFVQMQGSVYATFQLDARLLAYVHEELGQGPATAYEIFGMGWIVPGTAFVKVGRFVPAFGWRPADHRTFTRREFVFLPTNPPQSDTGVELGLRRGPFEVTAALTNGEFASPFELNDELAFVARGMAMHAVGPANLSLGGSYWQHRGLDQERWAGGPFGGASWGPVTWWGELDWLHSIFPAPAGGSPLKITTSFTTSQELSIQIVQGVDVVGTYDFHDPDMNFASGAGERIGGGVEAWPFPALRVRAKLNYFRLDDGPDAPPLPDDVLEGEVEIHFLY